MGQRCVVVSLSHIEMSDIKRSFFICRCVILHMVIIVQLSLSLLWTACSYLGFMISFRICSGTAVA